MAVRVVTALHQFKAPTATGCGHLLSIWSMENGIPLRGTFCNIPIHRTQSLARPRVRGRILEDRAVVRARDCIFHARRARLWLHTAFAGSLRSATLKVMTLYGGWICRGSVCRWSLRFRAEGFCDTVLRVGSSACVKGAGVQASLLVRSLSSGCWAGCGE